MPVEAERPLIDLAPYEVIDAVVGRARALAGAPAGLYVLDLNGTCLSRVAGDEPLPERIEMGQHMSAQIHRALAGSLRRRVAANAGGAAALPLWTGEMATAVLVVPEGGGAAVEALVKEAAPVLDAASRLTDVIACARRIEPTSAAAELQAALLPPRTNRFPGARVAGNILPAYDVGGDWFDHAHTGAVARFSVADAAGKGARAMALAALTLGALRSARRSGGGLVETAAACDEAVRGFGAPDVFVTALLGCWDPRSRRVSWINCGHPPPLLCRRDGAIEEMSTVRNFPLGIGDERSLALEETPLAPGERFVAYSDGITDRRTRDGDFFGIDRLHAVLRETAGEPPAVTVSQLISEVAHAGDDDVHDDATVFVLAAEAG